MSDPSTHHLPPYFDATLSAWVLTRHQDVVAALRSVDLDPDSPDSETADRRAALETLRQDTLSALSAMQLRTWSERITFVAQTTVRKLPEWVPIDLIECYLRPVCLDLAATVTLIAAEDAEALRDLGWPVSASAADPADPVLKAAAKAVTPRLQACFHSKTETLRDSGFIALAYTLPCLLANACHALLETPAQWTLLHQHPELMEQATDELMRFAGLTRVVHRRAGKDLLLGGASLRKGDRLILQLLTANHDPDRFHLPSTLNVERRGGGQLTLGAGAHACVGASLIRMAMATILRAVTVEFTSALLAQSITWQGGSGFRSPASLHVVLDRGLELGASAGAATPHRE